MKQDMMGDSGIRWAVCKSLPPRSGQITVTLFQSSCWVSKWKNCECRPAFDEITGTVNRLHSRCRQPDFLRLPVSLLYARRHYRCTYSPLLCTRVSSVAITTSYYSLQQCLVFRHLSVVCEWTACGV